MIEKPHILLVDDESKIRKLVIANLSSLGYEVTGVVDGRAALKALDTITPDLILLDVMLPLIDGFMVLEQIRSKSTVPVIMLTAKNEAEDKIKGFDLGADDYLSKPFLLQELFARVKAVLRRTNKADGTSILPGKCSELCNGELRVDQAEQRCWWREIEILLTTKEFRLLSFLMRHIGAVVTHEQILLSVWGEECVGELQYLRVSIARLRQKLRVAGCPDAIKTYSGVGYLLENLGASSENQKG